jgi:hypothetical protein
MEHIVFTETVVMTGRFPDHWIVFMMHSVAVFLSTGQWVTLQISMLEWLKSGTSSTSVLA